MTQTDFDGKSERLEKIVAVEMEGDTRLSIYPTMVKNNQLTVAYTAEHNGTLSLSFYDVAGRLVDQKSFDVTRGDNEFNLEFSSKFDFGVYSVFAQDGIFTSVNRIVKMK